MLSRERPQIDRLTFGGLENLLKVADSLKFDRASLYKICEFDEINTLITDPGIPDEISRALERTGVNLVIV